MRKSIHTFHLLFTRHVVPFLLANTQHSHLLFACHLGPLERVEALWTRQRYFILTQSTIFQGFIPGELCLRHHALAIFAEQIDSTSQSKVLEHGAVLTVTIGFVTVRVTVMLATSCSLLLLATSNLRRILLIPTFLLL